MIDERKGQSLWLMKEKPPPRFFNSLFFPALCTSLPIVQVHRSSTLIRWRPPCFFSWFWTNLPLHDAPSLSYIFASRIFKKENSWIKINRPIRKSDQMIRSFWQIQENYNDLVTQFVYGIIVMLKVVLNMSWHHFFLTLYAKMMNL